MSRPIYSDEQKLIDFFKREKIKFKFIGNSGFNVGKYFPDFISYDKKTLLEHIFDNKKIQEKRRVIYESLGYKVIFIGKNLVRRKNRFIITMVKWYKQQIISFLNPNFLYFNCFINSCLF